MSAGFYRDQLVQFWEEMHDTTVLPVHNDEAYPTRPAMDFLSAFIETTDEKFLTATLKQFQYARERATLGGLMPSTNGIRIERDSQTRQLYNFLIAAHLLEHRPEIRTTILGWADECATSMMKLPRVQYHCLDQPYGGESRDLFCSVYKLDFSLPDIPAVPSMGEPDPTIDVNQSAAVGMAFTLLYNTKGSIHHKKPEVLSIAAGELEASLSTLAINWHSDTLSHSFPNLPFEQAEYNTFRDTADKNRGDIGIPWRGASMDLFRYDTLYGGYTTWSWCLAYHFWSRNDDPKNLAAGLMRALVYGAKWLSTNMDVRYSSHRWFKQTDADGNQVVYDTVGPAGYAEAWYRVPAYWTTAVIGADARRMWVERCLRDLFYRYKVYGPGDATPFCYFRLLGMPEYEYIPG